MPGADLAAASSQPDKASAGISCLQHSVSHRLHGFSLYNLWGCRAACEARARDRLSSCRSTARRSFPITYPSLDCMRRYLMSAAMCVSLAPRLYSLVLNHHAGLQGGLRGLCQELTRQLLLHSRMKLPRQLPSPQGPTRRAWLLCCVRWPGPEPTGSCCTPRSGCAMRQPSPARGEAHHSSHISGTWGLQLIALCVWKPESQDQGVWGAHDRPGPEPTGSCCTPRSGCATRQPSPARGDAQTAVQLTKSCWSNRVTESWQLETWGLGACTMQPDSEPAGICSTPRSGCALRQVSPAGGKTWLALGILKRGRNVSGLTPG